MTNYQELEIYRLKRHADRIVRRGMETIAKRLKNENRFDPNLYIFRGLGFKGFDKNYSNKN